MKNKSTHGGRRSGAGRRFRKLTTSEKMLVVDALKGIILLRFNAGAQIALEVEDAIRLQHLDKKWSVNRDTLLTKLKHFNADAALGLLDAVDKFWKQGETK